MVGLASLVLLATPAAAEPDIKYPVVFTSLDELAELGISFDPYPWDSDAKAAKPRFPNTCYDYGLESVGPSFVSLSEEFLSRHKSRGFTRESVCMALVSGMRFDPETGRRLPTIVYKDEAAVKASIDELDMSKLDIPFYVPVTFKSKQALAEGVAAIKRGDLGKLTEEQISSLVGEGVYEEVPLVLPDCFKNATPYLDCTWRYGLHKGKKFTRATTKRYREFGRGLDRRFRDDIKNGHKKENEDRADPYLTQDGLFGEDVRLGLRYDEAPVTFFDISTAFPRGYGHALYATGEKDSGVSVSSILSAFDGSNSSSRFGLARLKKLFQ